MKLEKCGHWVRERGERDSERKVKRKRGNKGREKKRKEEAEKYLAIYTNETLT